MVSEDLHFYPESTVARKKGCHVTPLGIAGIVCLFIVCLLTVGLTVGLLGRPDCSETNTTTTTTTPSTTTTPGGDDGLSYRLPRAVFPSHYDLEIRPDLDPEGRVFDGTVIITLQCKEDTDNVTLNMDGLKINDTDVTIQGPTGEMEIADVRPVPDKYLLVIKVGDEGLKAGQEYNLTISYTGELQNNLIGLYYGTYKTAEGETRYFAATQFESTRARRALPCFDEPLFKAEFSVTILRRPEHGCLSNMPSLNNETREDGWVAESFAKSVKMSSYLLALYVGDLEYAVINSTLPIDMKVWARADGIGRTDYVQWVADEQMDGFQNYFNIAYALPKMDHVGLPEMGPGAMENYGLIKYRESYVIVDGNSTPDARQASAFIFGHEIGHQWFGNLVTMVWWDDIWLNEGFASLCEYIGVDFVHPDWKPWEQFLYRTMEVAMTADSLRNSRVIRHDANTPDEISANFDAIAYRKGATILRMSRDLMGPESFRRGITRYLKKHMFGNTVSDDLWASLTEQTEEDGKFINMTELMHTWTLQMNYPVIHVTRDYVTMTARLRQSRFLLDTCNDTREPDGSQSEYGYKWIVPLSYTNQDNSSWDNPEKVMLKEDEMSVEDTGEASKWFLLNVKRHGMYRVNYDEQNWQLLINQLNTDHTVFPPENRAQIVEDALHLARAGLLNQSLALSTTEFLSKEKDLTPWKTAEVFFNFMHEILARTPVYGSYKRYIVQLISPLIEELGWVDKGDHLERMLRGTLIRLACLFGHEECVHHAVQLYDLWRVNDTEIAVGIREVVYCTALREGGEEEWDYAWSRFLVEQDPSHRGSLRDAMTCSNQLWILSRYLYWGRDTSKIKRGESDIVLVGIAQNPIGREMVWQTLQQHWASADDAIYGKKRIADHAFNGFYTLIDVQELEEFRDKYIDNHANAKHLIFAAVERAWISYRWMNKSLNEMGEWFDKATMS